MSRTDQDLWYNKSDHYDGYDYIATHVDDLIISGKKPQDYMALIEQEFMLRNVEDFPKYYLGNDMKKVLDKYIHTAPVKYVKEMLRQ